jgi:hypothetical protein
MAANSLICWGKVSELDNFLSHTFLMNRADAGGIINVSIHLKERNKEKPFIKSVMEGYEDENGRQTG